MNPIPGKTFADIQLECQMYYFKWEDIPETQDDTYEKEEIANFLGQCRAHEEELVGVIKALGLPI